MKAVAKRILRSKTLAAIAIIVALVMIVHSVIFPTPWIIFIAMLATFHAIFAGILAIIKRDRI